MLILPLLFLAILLAGCRSNSGDRRQIADYGTYGSDLALRLARSWPTRPAGSAAERAAASFLMQAFSQLGYQPARQEFKYQYGEASGQSQNIVVRISGRGFDQKDADGQQRLLSRQVIIGAHYDAMLQETGAAALPAGTAGAPVFVEGHLREATAADFDGIQGNASGIGALLTLAAQLRGGVFGYDIVLVAFGAGTAGYAGAEFFAGELGSAALRTDAMYCLDSIYAGDKVYAHAGRNALLPNSQRDYDKRRKLYEATDVFYDNQLATNNGYTLYTNQSTYNSPVPNSDKIAYYREWTVTDSDYVPFDRLGIPIVFFESFDYDAVSIGDTKESRDPYFQATNGAIRGTRYDSSAILRQLFLPSMETRPTTVPPRLTTTTTANPTRTSSAARSAAAPSSSAEEQTLASTLSMRALARTDRLTSRINNTAFVLLECLKKGPPNSTIR